LTPVQKGSGKVLVQREGMGKACFKKWMFIVMPITCELVCPGGGEALVRWRRGKIKDCASVYHPNEGGDRKRAEGPLLVITTERTLRCFGVLDQCGGGGENKGRETGGSRLNQSGGILG